MKKAKIFLTALTVLAVVGGAVAFKAKTLKHFADKCDLTEKQCILNDFFSLATTNGGINPAPFEAYGAPCTTDDDCTFTLTTITD